MIMETITVKVLDYYNRPGYYKYMPDEIFTLLEDAFLKDQETVELPKHVFIKMIDNINSQIQ